jgi:outer membrane protein assembly factor BamA
VQVAEGLQFRMGTLQFVGLTDADAANLTRRWKLKPGQVFDTSYLREFLLNEILQVQKQRRLVAKPPVVTADLTARTVNVRYEFTDRPRPF